MASGLFTGNDNVIFISGVVDSLDPTNTDGSPKIESTATVAWQIRSGPMAQDGTPGGSLIASGSGVWSASLGQFYCELSHTIAFYTGSYLHVTITDGNGNKAVLEDSFSTLSRTGRTPTT